jgi:hypothetical protein
LEGIRPRSTEDLLDRRRVEHPVRPPFQVVHRRFRQPFLRPTRAWAILPAHLSPIRSIAVTYGMANSSSMGRKSSFIGSHLE